VTPYAQAIRDRRLLSFCYDGLPRTVVPAVYGRTRRGARTLRAYQVDGASHSSPGERWRLFTVDKIASCVVLDEVFTEPPPGYRRPDSAFRLVVEQL